MVIINMDSCGDTSRESQDSFELRHESFVLGINQDDKETPLLKLLRRRRGRQSTSTLRLRYHLQSLRREWCLWTSGIEMVLDGSTKSRESVRTGRRLVVWKYFWKALMLRAMLGLTNLLLPFYGLRAKIQTGRKRRGTMLPMLEALLWKKGSAHLLPQAKQMMIVLYNGICVSFRNETFLSSTFCNGPFPP